MKLLNAFLSKAIQDCYNKMLFLALKLSLLPKIQKQYTQTLQLIN